MLMLLGFGLTLRAPKLLLHRLGLSLRAPLSTFRRFLSILVSVGSFPVAPMTFRASLLWSHASVLPLHARLKSCAGSLLLFH